MSEWVFTDKFGRERNRRTHCKHGHKFDGTERWHTNWRGYKCRVCRVCAHLRMERKRANPDFRANEAAKVRRWRAQNKEAANIVANRAYRKRDEWLRSFKTSCRVCGESRYPCLDFHHRDPSQKDVTIGQVRHWSRERLRTEIEKCDILCANCHRWHHWEEKHKGNQ